jgi:hypothetical protein
VCVCVVPRALTRVLWAATTGQEAGGDGHQERGSSAAHNVQGRSHA